MATEISEIKRSVIEHAKNPPQNPSINVTIDVLSNILREQKNSADENFYASDFYQGSSEFDRPRP